MKGCEVSPITSHFSKKNHSIWAPSKYPFFHCKSVSVIFTKVSLAKYEVIQSHTIHGTGIFTYIWLIFMVNVGKYTSPMDPMGFKIMSNNDNFDESK